MIHIILFHMELLPSLFPTPFFPFSILYMLVESKDHLQLRYIYYFSFSFGVFVFVSTVHSFRLSISLFLADEHIFFGWWFLCKLICRKIRVKNYWLTHTISPKTETDNIWLSFIHIGTFLLLLIHFKLIACFGIGEVGDLMSTRQQKHKRKKTSYDSITTQFPFINEVVENVWLIVFHFIDFLFSTFFFLQFSCFIFKCYIFRLIQEERREGSETENWTDIQVIPVACIYDLFLCYDVFIMMRGEQQQLFDLKKSIRDRMNALKCSRFGIYVVYHICKSIFFV